MLNASPNLSRREAADYLRISVPRLDRRLRDGSVPSFLIGGRRIVLKDALEAISLQPVVSDLVEALASQAQAIATRPNPVFAPEVISVFSPAVAASRADNPLSALLRKNESRDRLEPLPGRASEAALAYVRAVGYQPPDLTVAKRPMTLRRADVVKALASISV
jgi:hypothetical protein